VAIDNSFIGTLKTRGARLYECGIFTSFMEVLGGGHTTCSSALLGLSSLEVDDLVLQRLCLIECWASRVLFFILWVVADFVAHLCGWQPNLRTLFGGVVA
jgi:ABC-type microcin C transport system permease subunit YejE